MRPVRFRGRREAANWMLNGLRFVILHHRGIPDPHYDLMLEGGAGGKLVTWRVPRWPIGRAIGVERLADHRREYLDYQGPVSGGRGYVERVEAGTYRLEEGTLDGNNIRMMLLPSDVRLELWREGDSWSARPA